MCPSASTKHHAMKGHWGSGSIAPRFLDLGTRWRWMVSFTPRPFYPQRKSPWYPLDRRLGGAQNRSGRCGKEKDSQAPIIQPIAQRYTTELSQLLCSNIKKWTILLFFHLLPYPGQLWGQPTNTLFKWYSRDVTPIIRLHLLARSRMCALYPCLLYIFTVWRSNAQVIFYLHLLC